MQYPTPVLTCNTGKMWTNLWSIFLDLKDWVKSVLCFAWKMSLMKSIVPKTLPTPRNAHFSQLCHNLLYLCLLVGCLHLNLLNKLNIDLDWILEHIFINTPFHTSAFWLHRRCDTPHKFHQLAYLNQLSCRKGTKDGYSNGEVIIFSGVSSLFLPSIHVGFNSISFWHSDVFLDAEDRLVQQSGVAGKTARLVGHWK